MNPPGCERIGLAELIAYAAREPEETEAAAFEEHLFSCADCGARAAEFDALVRAIGPAIRSGKVGGFVTDDILNQLAREGIRVRTFTLSPGAVVPCAVWEDDELIAMRLRADLGGASEFTMSQRVAGAEDCGKRHGSLREDRASRPSPGSARRGEFSSSCRHCRAGLQCARCMRPCREEQARGATPDPAATAW